MKEKHLPKYHKFIKKLLNSGQKEALAGLLNNMDPVEIANALIQLKLKHQIGVLDVLTNEVASEVLSHLHDSPILDEITGQLKTEKLSVILEEMPRDDAADFLSSLAEEQQDAILHKLPQRDRQEITSLLQYNEESAGGIMDPYVVTAFKGQSVQQAVASIRKYAETHEHLETFYTVYVIDEYNHLIGTIGTTALLLSDPNKLLYEIMDPDVVAVDVDLDQEEVARIAREYDLVVVPVIDKHLRLIGRITIDDLVDVMSDEFEEDIAIFAGTGDENVLEKSVLKTSRDRLPWLLLALFGGILAAFVMNFYEASLAKMPKVAYFVPLIAALGGNIGIQSSSIVVRGLATGEIGPSDLFVRLWKELRVGLISGVVCALCLVVLAYFMTDNLVLSGSTGFALIFVVCLAAMIGGCVPILLRRLSIDPALATGPFITTANDVLGILIYLTFAFHIEGVINYLTHL